MGKENEELKEEIIETVNKIQNEQILILIRGFVVSGFNEEKAGK